MDNLGDQSNLYTDEFVCLEEELIASILQFLPFEDKFKYESVNNTLNVTIFEKVLHLPYYENLITNHNGISFGQNFRLLESKLFNLESIDFKYLETYMQEIDYSNYLPQICRYIHYMQLNPWNLHVCIAIPLCSNLRDVDILGLEGIKIAMNASNYCFFRGLKKFAFNYKTGETLYFDTFADLNKNSLEFLEIHINSPNSSIRDIFTLFDIIAKFHALKSLKLVSNLEFESDLTFCLNRMANNSSLKELYLKIVVKSPRIQKDVFALLKYFKNLKRITCWIGFAENQIISSRELMPLTLSNNRNITHITIVSDLKIGKDFMSNIWKHFPNLQSIELSEVDELNKEFYIKLITLKHIRQIDIIAKRIMIPINYNEREGMRKSLLGLLALSKHLTFVNIVITSNKNWSMRNFDKSKLDLLRKRYRHVFRKLQFRSMQVRRQLLSLPNQ